MQQYQHQHKNICETSLHDQVCSHNLRGIQQKLLEMGFIATHIKRHLVDGVGDATEIGTSKHAMTMKSMSMSKQTYPAQKIQHTLIFLLHGVN